MVARNTITVSEIPMYKIQRLKEIYKSSKSIDYLYRIGWRMGLNNEEVTNLISINFLKIRKEIKVSTEDFDRSVPVEDRCPTKTWLEYPKTLKMEQVERGVWDSHHTIGNVICEF